MWQKRHFSKVCRSTQRGDSGSDEEEVFFISVVKMTSGHPVVTTCTLNQKHKVVFELDTEASCNILPLAEYVKATVDTSGQHIQETRTYLTMHNRKANQKGHVVCGMQWSQPLALFLYHAFTSNADSGEGCLHRNATNQDSRL